MTMIIEACWLIFRYLVVYFWIDISMLYLLILTEHVTTIVRQQNAYAEYAEHEERMADWSHW